MSHGYERSFPGGPNSGPPCLHICSRYLSSNLQSLVAASLFASVPIFVRNPRDDYEAPVTTIFPIKMRTITHFIVIVHIISSAASISASFLPYLPDNVANKHDEQSRIDTRDNQTTPSHS